MKDYYLSKIAVVIFRVLLLLEDFGPVPLPLMSATPKRSGIQRSTWAQPAALKHWLNRAIVLRPRRRRRQYQTATVFVTNWLRRQRRQTLATTIFAGSNCRKKRQGT